MSSFQLVGYLAQRSDRQARYGNRANDCGCGQSRRGASLPRVCTAWPLSIRREPCFLQRDLSSIARAGAESFDSDNDRFAWAEIYAEAAKLPGVDRVGLRTEALTLYEGLAKPSPFQRQRHAELLIDMGNGAEGEAMPRTQEQLVTSEWLQRLMARARLKQGDAQDALAWINQALARLKAEHFRSEFLELRYAIRAALGEADARADLLAARAASQKVAEAARLDERIRKASQSAAAD